jgi:hypothetical protein
MNRVLSLALGVVMIASLAFGQGYIGLYSDSPYYTDCNLVDATVGLCPVYLVQHFTNGISSSLTVDSYHSGGIINTGVTIHTALSIGDVFTGIDFSYGACLGPTVLLATLNYFCQGVTPPCSSLRVIPPPTRGYIVIVDCSPTVRQASGGWLSINGNPWDCPCWGPPAVEERSWGQIKALYE